MSRLCPGYKCEPIELDHCWRHVDEVIVHPAKKVGNMLEPINQELTVTIVSENGELSHTHNALLY